MRETGKSSSWLGSRDAASPQSCAPQTKAGLTQSEAGMEQGDDDTVYCDIQMPVAQGRELLELVIKLRESKAYLNLDTVFEHMQDELSTSIDIAENQPSWNSWFDQHRTED